MAPENYYHGNEKYLLITHNILGQMSYLYEERVEMNPTLVLPNIYSSGRADECLTGGLLFNHKTYSRTHSKLCMYNQFSLYHMISHTKPFKMT